MNAPLRLAVRAHDIPAEDPKELCEKLLALPVREIQLVPHKSFPDFVYDYDHVEQLAQQLKKCGIHVAVYGCYIDPLSPGGRERFLRHIHFAAQFGADCIATESALQPRSGLTEQEHELLKGTFAQFARQARQCGLCAAVETVAIHPVATPQQTLELLRQVPGLRAILDAENLRGPHPVRGADPALQALDLYGGCVAAVHWKSGDAMADPAILAWLKEHPQVPLVTEGICGSALTTFLDTIKEVNYKCDF